jgi:3-methyl-2-oxobutanoate hydroxymethyltransferase
MPTQTAHLGNQRAKHRRLEERVGSTGWTHGRCAAHLLGLAPPTQHDPRFGQQSQSRSYLDERTTGPSGAGARDASEIFDEAGIPVLLIGDSAANNVYGYETTLPVTVDDLIPLVRAVTRSDKHAPVVADLPFGFYHASPAQALGTATRFMEEGLAYAVKLEGGRAMVPEVELLVGAGIPAMGHIGFTPQSEHMLGGYRIQGRGDAADALVEDAIALDRAGAFSVLMEMIPASVAARVTEVLHIPTIGIGAGPSCDAQVLVWQGMAGLRGSKAPRFVKRYADLRTSLGDAARAYAPDVAGASFPAAEHSFRTSGPSGHVFGHTSSDVPTTAPGIRRRPT